MLFNKLSEVGLGGKTRTIIQNLYFNDCISIEVNGEFCKKIFLTNGVKQGKKIILIIKINKYRLVKNIK